MQCFLYILFYYFMKGKKTTKTHTKKICAGYTEGAVTDQMSQKWFANFLGTFDILAK